jgi:hypothetical protein
MRLSTESKPTSTPISTIPSSSASDAGDPNQPYPIGADGTSRDSDVSSHHPAVSNDTTGSGSHRLTRELGDFYDSYWRQSTQGPSMAGRGNDVGRPHPSGYSASRGPGESGKDSRRPGPMDIKVATIAEVETPLASPMPGTAL